LASRKNFAELVKTTEHRFSSFSFRLLTWIGTYYATAGGVVKKLKLTIVAEDDIKARESFFCVSVGFLKNTFPKGIRGLQVWAEAYQSTTGSNPLFESGGN
jgi:hypothetical protein